MNLNVQEAAGWELAWNLLVGGVLTAAYWPAALLLGLTLLSWPAWLTCRGGLDRLGLRWGLGAYAVSRLMTDFVFWGPIVAGWGLLWVGLCVNRESPGWGGVRRLALKCMPALAGVVLSLKAPHWPVTHWAVCALLTGLVFSPITVNALDRPGARPGWWRCLWVGMVLSLPVDGLTQQVYLPLVGLGMVGWVAFAFALWQGRARKTPGLLWGRGRLGGRLGTIAWGLAGVLGALMILEVYFQWIYDASDGHVGLKTSRLWWKRHVAYNAWGFRDREFEPLNRFDDALRVVILGDSFAFGQGVAQTQALLGPLLETELSKRLTDATTVACFNLSNVGIATDRELSIFEHAAPRIRPQAVVLVYMLNDIGEAVVFKAIGHPALDRWRRLTEASVALDFLVWRIYIRWFMPGLGQPPLELTYFADQEVFGRHCQSIDRLVTAVHDAGCQMVVAVYPYLDMPPVSDLQQQALNAILPVFKRHGLPVIDVTQLVDLSDPRYVANRFDAHPSAELNRVLAAAIADALTETIGGAAGNGGEAKQSR